MDDTNRLTVAQTFAHILEKYAFMFGELVPEQELPPLRGTFRQALLNFTGPVQGSLCLVIPAPMARELAANAIGVEPEKISESHAEDAYVELLNVACARILMTIAGQESAFELSTPELGAIEPKNVARMAKDPQTISFIVDDNPVLLLFELKEDPAKTP